MKGKELEDWSQDNTLTHTEGPTIGTTVLTDRYPFS